MNLSPRALTVLTAVLLLGLASAGPAWRMLWAGEAAPAEDEDFDVDGISTVASDLSLGSQPVVGVLVVMDTLHLQVVTAGLAEASRESRLATRAAGVVERVLVREGQLVREGDVLVQLDTVQAAMNVLRAGSALLQAEAQYRERMRGGQGILPPEEEAARERIVRSESGLTAAELNLMEREMELEFTRVRAPFSGRVADLRAVAGAFLNQGGEVLTLMQIDPIHVRVEVLEAELAGIAPGHRARARFNALGGETRAARVESLNPIVDPQSRAGRVTLSLPNPDGRILPGSYAWVTLDTEALPNRVLIPREAVLTRGDQRDEVVFVLENADSDGRGVAEMRSVALGLRNATHVEVVQDEQAATLHPGEIVLVDGHHFLALGTFVHLVENESRLVGGGQR
jgi:RND family efflux transporter MFP subunit